VITAPPIRTPLLDANGQLTRAWQVWLTSLTTSTLPVFANNAAAKAGGLSAGDTYRTGTDPDLVAVVD
jgi:hypothetical protein